MTGATHGLSHSAGFFFFFFLFQRGVIWQCVRGTRIGLRLAGMLPDFLTPLSPSLSWEEK